VNAPRPPQSGSFASRVVVTVVAVGGFAALAWADAAGWLGAPAGCWLAPVAVVAGWGAASEVVRMAASRGLAIGGPILPTMTAMVPLATLASTAVPGRVGSGPAAAMGWAAVGVVAGLAVMLIVELVRYRPAAGSLGRLATGGFTVTAIGLPIAFMVGLRLLGEGRGIGGVLPLVSLVAVVKGGDIAAYVVGSLAGRRKLAPLVSPGKTWEGAAASLAASLVLAWLTIDAGQRLGMTAPWGGWPLFGIAVGVAGMIGDLAESLVKRELATKDSGRWLGGLGGFLDLVDALLLAAPVAWLLWALGGPTG